jgi:hypothetical protein
MWPTLVPATDIKAIKIANSGRPRIACAETLAPRKVKCKIATFCHFRKEKAQRVANPSKINWQRVAQTKANKKRAGRQVKAWRPARA